MALHWFYKDISFPVNLIFDAHQAKTSIKVKIFCDQVGTILKTLEKVTPWKNRAELYIFLLKEAVSNDMHALH